MCDRNVLPFVFDDQADANYGTQALFRSQIAPKNFNIDADGIPSGDVVFELNTGKDTFLDLSKTYLTMRWSLAVNGVNPINNYVLNNMLLLCMFSRATVYLNGTKLAQSNNYTQDGALSRRLQFGRDYNQSISGMYDIPDTVIANAALASTAGSYTAIDTLDSFWLRTNEGLIVPPNSNLRLEFTIDSNYIAKCVMKTAAATIAAGGTIKIKSFAMNPCFYVSPSEVKSDYRFRFVGLNSFMSSLPATETNKNIQYTISPTIIKAILTHLPATYQANDGNAKWATAYQFNAGQNLKTLQFKVGNVVFPQTVYSFETYGFQEAYMDYVSQTQQIARDSGKESFKQWLGDSAAAGAAAGDMNQTWGPVIVAPIVKDISDPTNTIEVNSTYSGVNAVIYTILTCLEEHRYHTSTTEAGIMTAGV